MTMFDHPLPETEADSGADGLAGIETEQVKGPRLPNSQKLLSVPLFGYRELLELRDPGNDLEHLSQAELVARADGLTAITPADVEELFEHYRYGRQLSFYLYLLPDNLTSPAMEEIQDALDGLAEPDHADLANEVSTGEDYETETSPFQITLLDYEKFDGICELRFRLLRRPPVPQRRRGAGPDFVRAAMDSCGLTWSWAISSFSRAMSASTAS